MNNASTKALWTNAHGALCAGSWRNALEALDLLSYRNDNRDLLCELPAYEGAAGSKPEADLAAAIQCRIAIINVNVRSPHIRRSA